MAHSTRAALGHDHGTRRFHRWSESYKVRYQSEAQDMTERQKGAMQDEKTVS
jgi:hypothetical protein